MNDNNEQKVTYDLAASKKKFALQEFGHEYFDSEIKEWQHWQNNDKVNSNYEELANFHSKELQSENTALKLEVEKYREALNMIQTECNNSDIAFNISIDRIETILYNVFNP